MMKRVKELSLVLLLSIFVFSAPLANAQKPANASKSQGLENQIPDLTEKQKDEISTLRTAHMKESQQLKNQMGIKRAELKALQQAENPDIDAINKKIEERAEIRLKLEKETAAFKQSVRNVLTDEQKVIFDQKSSHHNKGNAHNCSHSKPGHGCSKAQQQNCGKK